jgi:predicted O-methyltransferase YrrM
MKHSELLQQIETLVPSLGGWAIPEKCCEFAATILSTRPLVTVELGTWMGRGAFSMALAHRFTGRGRVWVVDPWSAQASADGQDGKNAEWWAVQERHEIAYTQFCQTLSALDLAAWVHVQRKTSDEAEVPDGIGLLIVDANHGPQAVKDVERWVPNVAPGGIVYLDDLNWTGGAVRAAGERLLELGFAALYERDQGMFYQRMQPAVEPCAIS